MRSIWTFVATAVRYGVRAVWGLLAFAGVVTGATLVGVVTGALTFGPALLAIGIVVIAVAVVVIGAFKAWSDERSHRVGLERERDSGSPTISLVGGTGGAGGGGGVGDVVIAGHGGDDGNVAYGPGSRAEGGKGGRPGGPTAFEALARASMGMGYALDEFIEAAGFDPFDSKLDGIGRGGDGSTVAEVVRLSGGAGGDGLILVTSRATGSDKVNNVVIVCRTDGWSIIRRRDSASGTRTPVERFSNPGAPGETYEITLPPQSTLTSSRSRSGPPGAGAVSRAPNAEKLPSHAEVRSTD